MAEDPSAELAIQQQSPGYNSSPFRAKNDSPKSCDPVSERGEDHRSVYPFKSIQLCPRSNLVNPDKQANLISEYGYLRF